MLNNTKFEIVNNQLTLVDSGEVIPDNEPGFILRGKDRRALSTIGCYQGVCALGDEWKQVQKVIESFREFRENNPELMANPLEVY